MIDFFVVGNIDMPPFHGFNAFVQIRLIQGIQRKCFRLTNLYWRQRLANGNVTITAGFLDVTDYVDAYALASPWTGFGNLVFSTGSATIGLPNDATLGIAAGVMLTDFHDPGIIQTDLFDNSSSARARGKDLMAVVDMINNGGKGQVFFAGQGIKKQWSMKRGNLSPAYTTRWADIVKVR